MTARDSTPPSFGRIVRPADYVRVLGTPMRLRSPHFAVHHLDGRPLPLKRLLPRVVATPGQDAEASSTGTVDEAAASGHAPVNASLSTELSTGVPQSALQHVDDSPAGLVETTTPLGGCDRWLGLVVPKRHAKRAVTRTLVKRQIRNVAAACAPELEPGLWVVRQRHPFDPKEFPSAASDALKEAARAELRALFERAVRGERDKIKPRPPGAPTSRGKGGKPARKTPPVADAS